MTALNPRGVAADLGRADLRVEVIRDLARDDPLGVLPRPLLDVPIVVSPHDGKGQLGVGSLALQALAGEAEQCGGEVQRCEDAVDVHVGDTGVDIPRSTPHLIEPGGLKGGLDDRAADDGIEADVRIPLALELPELGAVIELHHLWGSSDKL